ncbi:MAG TPA: hypothetical protein V6C71_17090 [Coleofasciculaceae cyanobacterium]|jgi:hypothetical protein
MVSQQSGHPSDQEPDQWQKDLNPDPMAGQNHGVETTQEDVYDLTAYDLEELHDRLADFTKDELKKIPVLKVGTRLQQGATYINLNDPLREEFTGMGDMSAENNNLIIPKNKVGYELWNRLISS